MPDNIARTKGRPKGYKFDRGGMPAEFGPFIGIVKNNVDPTRSGRIQVYIEAFSGGDPDDESLWRTLSYVPPFFGSTPHKGTDQGPGTFVGNQQSYGIWFTPPDLDTKVVCFFAEGDPNQGYYFGCVPDPGVTHMVPAIGASRRFQYDNPEQATFFGGASQLPVTEINTENLSIDDDPKFYDKPKPVHSYVAGIMMQQGLIKDTTRGPITSNSQRESPSNVFGISTPGRAIYQGGLSEADIKGKLERGQIRPQDIEVIARRGGHSLVMDDGDLEGKDNLVRIRTAKGHQITMSDDGDCFYIIHANGQTWLEFGKQGTVDVFSTNSVNVRTQGTINLHADKDINMFAGENINLKGKAVKFESDSKFEIIGTESVTVFSKSQIGIRSDGTLAMKSTGSGSWDGGSALNLKAGVINLNSGGAATVEPPTPFKDVQLPDTKFQSNGWQVEFGALKTIVTRAPTHEPYPYHNEGVSTKTELGEQPPQNLKANTASTLGRVAEQPVSNGIDTASLLKQTPADISVGSLDPSQVTGMMAQQAADVGQAFDQVSVEKGIGKFGMSPQQLESAGYLKPGTVANYLKDPNQLQTILNSSTVWTGKGGVGNLNSLLADEKLQSLTQNELMIGSLDGLKSAGIVTGNETPAELSAFVQNATKYGVANTAAWVNGKAPADLVAKMNQSGKNAQYAVNFVDDKTSDIFSGVKLGGFTDTAQRSSVDSALSKVIGNPKIPLPNFGQSLYSGTATSDLTYSGDDPIVLARINEERQRRGLPPLGTVT